MPARPRVSAVLLAAGRAERFGGGKLGAELLPGLTILARSLLGLLDEEAGLDGDVWLVGQAAVVGPWLGHLAGHPRLTLVESSPDGGQGDSLAAGVRALPAGDAVLVALGDQPFAAPTAVRAVLARHRRAPAQAAVAAGQDGRRMPPVLFAPHLRGELEGLRGDRGARDVLSSVGAATVEMGAGAWALDVDRREDLAALRTAAARDPIACGHAGMPA